ncbi:MAG: S1 RNA-binding domain-containing protein [Planctomycetota bacterium]|nr:S1 RNA-binding domain-containing protein [Planctomycetota bacterium]
MRPQPSDSHERDHGAHTLKVWRGVVVGVFGADVFVELGPRMQGVISVNKFENPPAIGDAFEFTLRGQEEGLWSLSLAVSLEKSVVTWEKLEIGSLVHARAIREAPGGLEMKIGPLHAFLPKSHSGLPREMKLETLVGKNFTCEVIEVDSQRARVTVSRKIVLQRERESEHQRLVDQLKIGELVQGRVTRIEDYGAFVAFGKGMEGLVHISNLCFERVAHPSEIVKLGQSLELKVLALKKGGKRIALGLKQVGESPWRDAERTLFVGAVVEGVVTRVLGFGAFVAIKAGVEGLVPISETGAQVGRPLASVLEPGTKVSVRVLSFDTDRERLSLSLLHQSGQRIAPEEAQNRHDFDEIASERQGLELKRRLGDVLKRAWGSREPGTGSIGA